MLAFVFIVAHVSQFVGLIPVTPQLASREIIGTMADALFVLDRDSVIQFVNPAAVQLLGFDENALIGKRIQELLVTDSDEVLDKTLRRRTPHTDASYQFRSANGEPIELTLSVAPVSQQGDVAGGAIIIGRDVSEVRRAQREAQRAVALLQSTLDSTTDGILVLDERGGVLAYNQKLLDMRCSTGVPDRRRCVRRSASLPRTDNRGSRLRCIRESVPYCDGRR